MSYFAPYIDQSGLHVPEYSEILEYLITGYKNIFGTDIYLGEDTQDYQLLSLFAKSLDDFGALAIEDYNARNPNYATGESLDLLLAMAGIRRKPATASKAVLTLRGTPSAVMPSGQYARDQAGYTWRLSGNAVTDERGVGTGGADITFDGDGYAYVTATCTTLGAIAADVGMINIVETPTSVWNSVWNAAAAVTGDDVESDAEARLRRSASMALSGIGTLDSMRSALTNLAGVEYVTVRENSTGSTDADGIPAHSICALVQGGSDDKIGETIYLQKAPGIGTYGNTSVSYTDTYGNQNTVQFSRPVDTPVTVSVSLRPLSGWDSDEMQSSMKAYLSAYINGLGIGEDLVVSALWGEAFKASVGTAPAFSVLSISAAKTGSGSTTDAIAAAYNTKFSCSADNITITVTEV